MSTSSFAATMFSGGEEAIIIGRLPTGQSGRRGARFTTKPARSRAAISSLSLMVSGRSCGFGTLSYHACQSPEPGSWRIHIPDKSACWAAAGLATASAATISRSVARMALWIQRERIQRVAGSDEHVLPSVHHVSFRSVRDLPGRRVPQRIAVCRIVGNEVAVRIATEEQPARGGEKSLAASIDNGPVLVFPRDLSCLRIDRHQIAADGADAALVFPAEAHRPARVEHGQVIHRVGIRR